MIFWRMLVTKQLLVAIDFYSREENNIEAMETSNCMLTKIIQNILFFDIQE